MDQLDPMNFNKRGSLNYENFSQKVAGHENWSGREKESSPKISLI